MKLDYLTDENEKCLASIFSKFMMSITFYSTFSIAGLLIIFWPMRSFFSYICTHTAPFSFFLVFSATLIINAYINLRCGRGEINKNIYYFNEVSEKENNLFLKYGLVESYLHTLLLMIPCLPLLILSASVSGISGTNFAGALTIVFTASLVCRLFAFMIYLFENRSGQIGYLLARAFIILFLFGTNTLAPTFNPFQMIYAINFSPDEIDIYYRDSYILYMAAVSFAVIFCTSVIRIKVKRHINKERLS